MNFETRCFGPFEVYGFPWPWWGFGLKRLNSFGPPPHALKLTLGPLRIVWWYRERPVVSQGDDG